MILGVGGRQERKEILRQGVEVPRGEKAAQSIQQIEIAGVAVSQAQSRHAAMLAHAAHDQEIGEAVGDRKKAGHRIAGKVDEGLVDDDQLEVGRLVQEVDHLFERNHLAGGIARIDDQQSAQAVLAHPGEIVRQRQLEMALRVQADRARHRAGRGVSRCTRRRSGRGRRCGRSEAC